MPGNFRFLYLVSGALAGVLTEILVSRKTKSSAAGGPFHVRTAVCGVLSALVFSAAAICFPAIGQIRVLPFSVLMLAIAIYDEDTHRIPNALILLSLIPFALTCIPMRDYMEALPGALLLGGGTLAVTLAADRLMGRSTLGGGDIKLLFVIGLYLKAGKGVLCLMTACLLALIGMVIRRKKVLAFGPYLCAAAMMCLFFGDLILDWYISL